MGLKVKKTILKIFFFFKGIIINIWYFVSKLLFKARVRDGVFSSKYSELMECALPVWYHDFERLGVKTKLIPFSGYREAQDLKDSIIIDYVKIIEKDERKTPKKGFELFCSDGYYSHYFAAFGYNMLGVDLCEESGEGKKRGNNLYHARLIQRILDNSGMTSFKKGDVFDVKENFDLIVNVGGLYHISDPISLIKQNINFLNQGGHLIIQSIVADIEDPDYFCTPAPGWNWGCRFSHSWLRDKLRLLSSISILDEREVNANYNRSTFDRKYSSFLIKKA